MTYKNIPDVLRVGYSQEQYSRRPGIDISEMLSELPDATPQLFVIRPTETESAPATVTLEGTTLYWEVNGYDTENLGTGKCQVVLTRVDTADGESVTRILESPVIRTMIGTTILDDAEDVPDPYESWVAQILAAAAQTHQDAQDAAASAASAEQSAAASAHSADQAQQDAESAAASEAQAAASAQAAGTSADRAEQAAAAAGYMDFTIDGAGHLIYEKCNVPDVDFELSEGRLIAKWQ